MLLIDAGNTSITLAALGADGVPVVLDDRLPSRDEAWLESYARQRAAHPDATVALSSVVPSVTAALRRREPGLFVVDETAVFPFGLGVAEPAAVGADRYCNMAAAVEAGWSDALVVDAGTATTFDILQGGVFVGGLIAPGLALAAETLAARAARLPEITLRPHGAVPAADTVGAMEAGAFQTGVRGVWGVVEALRAELGDPPLVLTGGLAPFLLDPLAAPPAAAGARHDPWWSLRGLAALASRR